MDGSWKFYFSYDQNKGNITVEKGSISVNGVSLTVVDSEKGHVLSSHHTLIHMM
jgi:riboflavin synthase